jgi:hypothetical protein
MKRLLSSLGLPVLFAAGCAASGDDAATGAESAEVACNGGIALPDVTAPGDAAAKKHTGVSLGELDERSPTELDPSQMASYTDAAGLRHQGWTFRAKRGERFAVDYRTTSSTHWVVYGPVEGCAAGATDAPASFEGINGWRARRDGTYFVTTDNGLATGADGKLEPQPNPQPSHARDLLAMRRLLADDTPAGHAFVPGRTWDIDKRDVRIATVSGEPKPVIFVTGYHLEDDPQDPANQYARKNVSTLLVLRRNADGTERDPLWVAPCNGDLGSIVTGDFTGDGRTDVVSGSNLFVGQADGSYACEAMNLIVYSSRIIGPIDVDGDGQLDFLGLQSGGANVRVQPIFRRGGTFVAGAYRYGTLPAGWQVEDPLHAALVDVTGDGRPEFVVGAHDSANPSTRSVFAAAAPTLSPEDAKPSPSSLLLDFGAIANDELRPDPMGLDNHGSTLFDADGDGIQDRLVAGHNLYTRSGFNLAYGKPDGTFLLPWEFTTGSFGDAGNESQIDHLDYDGDGCEDVLLANGNIAIFRGVRCKGH